MKITTSTDNIKSFGGLNFISEEFNKLNLPELITKHLGKCSLQAKYSFSDVIKNWWAITFAAGVCSPDTLLRLQKELALDKEIHISKSKTVNEYSKHSIFLP